MPLLLWQTKHASPCCLHSPHCDPSQVGIEPLLVAWGVQSVSVSSRLRKSDASSRLCLKNGGGMHLPVRTSPRTYTVWGGLNPSPALLVRNASVCATKSTAEMLFFLFMGSTSSCSKNLRRCSSISVPRLVSLPLSLPPWVCRCHMTTLFSKPPRWMS